MLKPRNPQPAAPKPPPPWYRVPFVWFAISLLVLIVAACVHFVVLAMSMDNSEVPGEIQRGFKVPVAPAKPEASDTDPDGQP